MSQGEQPDRAERLDALFDGQLPADERDALLRALASDATLADEQRLQTQIDASLGRLFDAPAPDPAWIASLAAQVVAERSVEVASQAPWTARLAAVVASRAGVIAALVVAAAAAWGAVAYQFLPSRPAPVHCEPTALERVYDEAVAAGFRPEWSTSNPADFSQACESQSGPSLALGPLGAGAEMTGLAYLHGLGPQTLAVMARVDGKPVIVFLGSNAAAASLPAPPTGTSLRRFTRQLGDMTLIEVTPHARPRLLASFQLAAPDAG